MFYLLILTLHIGLIAPLRMPEDARMDTLWDGTPVVIRAEVVSGPNRAAVELLEANHLKMPGDERWEGALYLVDIEGRRLTPVKLRRITTAHDTLDTRP